LTLDADSRFEPVGSTDTETMFCELLNRMAKKGWRSLGQSDPAILRGWFAELNRYGTMTTLMTDGHDLCVYADASETGKVFVWELLPPYGDLKFGDADLKIDLTKRGVRSRKGVILCSDRLERESADEVPWRQLEPGRLLVVRQGKIRAEAGPESKQPKNGLDPIQVHAQSAQQRPIAADIQRFSVTHKTVYHYERPVERSTHAFRLVPLHDRLQTLLGNRLVISVDGEPLVNGQQRDYEDVFGNRIRRIVIERPYTELSIESSSSVELFDTDPLSFRPLHARTTMPLVWMPWQGQVLQPFLLPQELPESELSELIDYAMSFAKRNDFDLFDTLLDINSSIFREYEYRQGATNIYTTPFEVYVNRRGVCQDFSNLFICLARLLGVPARYVCGYIYTGPKHPNQRQAEASHAWVQLYLPEVGWKGFDPTNGILTQTEHVRVAVGRNYVDATPTSGTIYVGGGGERLDVDVRMVKASE
jgi:transglutaminase-like putative cysteine protease